MKIQFQNINLEVIPNASHEWLIENSLVANGYDVTERAIRQHIKRNAADLIEGKHWMVANVPIANGGSKPSIFWTKKGIIRLGFFVKSEIGKEFRDWAEDLIINAISKPESPVENFKSLEQHAKREVQVQNSKDVNGYLFKNWNVETLIDYNRQNCRIVSGHSPSELKVIGKKAGLKSTQYSSGKEVLRNIKPALAAQMSLNDNLVQQGVKLVEANALSAPCLPMLSKMVELKLITV